MKTPRRQFLKAAAFAGAGLSLPWTFGIRPAMAAANSPTNLRKWIQPLRGLGPDGIPVAAGMPDPVFPNTTLYQLTAGEFLDQLHPDLPPTRLWGYWDTTNPVKRHLGGVIVARTGSPTRLRVTNTLPGRHILPVDTSLPGADHAQNRTAIHLHGGLVPWISDGGPFAWWAPDGSHGETFLNGPGSVFDNIRNVPGMPDQPILPGQADYYYPNNQSARLAWYHDHAHGITRLNAYAGLASGYLILDAINDAYVASGKIPGLASTLPLVFQDKIFVNPTTAETDPTWADVARPDVQSTGSLWYEHVYDPNVFELEPGGLPLPNPSCIPEFFGDTMLCNGTVYPLLTVEAKRYRFFILNACNARFLNINLFRAKPKTVDGIVLDPLTRFPMNPPGPTMRQIGTEGGFLVRDVKLNSPKPFNPFTLTGNLVLGPAERADVIIDFTRLEGQEIILYNDAPGPFPNGGPETDYYLGNPDNPIQPLPGTGPDTRQILRIKVVPATARDPQPPQPILDATLVDPPLLVPPPVGANPVPPLPPPVGAYVRNLTLNEAFDKYGRLTQLLGTANGPLEYLEPTTEVVQAGSTEVWRIINLSADTHPIHFHLVNVQVLSREPFEGEEDGALKMTGLARGPELNELGWKDTVQMHPGEVTTLAMKFDLPGGLPFAVPTTPRAAEMGLTDSSKTYHDYVWHCHILEHEEHDMMRPLVVAT